MLNHWPEIREKPHAASLWKWLQSAANDGRLARDGEGRPHKPFRYWIRGRERHFLPELPPLEPLGELDGVTDADVEYARLVVERGK